KLLSFYLFFIFCASTEALTLTESFTSRSNFDDTSTMVWNQALGELHPPLFVKDWSDGASESTDFSIGDGRHGSFTSIDDYRRFSSGGDISGQIIRFNTDDFPELHVTEF